MISRLGPRTAGLRDSRVPIARSECPGDEQGHQRCQRSRDRWTGRRPCETSTSASEARPHVVQGQPRPLPLCRTTRVVGSAASSAAIRGVSSMLALSAMVMRTGAGSSRRCRCSGAPSWPAPACSLYQRHHVDHRHGVGSGRSVRRWAVRRRAMSVMRSAGWLPRCRRSLAHAM